jgi:2-aminoadipate transaminase
MPERPSPNTRARTPEPDDPPDTRFVTSAIRDLLHHARQPGTISLAGGLPAEDALPVTRLREAADRVLTKAGPAAVQYGLTEGEPALRELVASGAGRRAGEVVVTAGSQQALDLLVATLCRPGDPVAMEEPGYLGARQVLRARQVRTMGVPVDVDGLDVDHLEWLLATGPTPRLLYLNPSFQNPTGASLAPERAERVVELAERYRFHIAADDPYRELWFTRPPVDLPDGPLVVHLRSSSKVIAPGLRVGWLLAHPDLARRVAVAKQPADLQTSTLNQLMVAELLADTGWWGSHCRELRSLYRSRRDALVAALDGAGVPVPAVPDGGFFCWLPASRDPHRSLPAALETGVAYVPGSEFTADRTGTGSGTPPSRGEGGWEGAIRPGRAIRLSFSNADPARFVTAVDRLRTLGVLAP